MKLKLILLTFFLAVTYTLAAQTAEINKTDQQGKKLGPWIRKYPNGSIQYEGTFKDDHPVGEFKRYYQDRSLMSVMIYSDDGRMADATIYHPNGFISSKGKYIDQKKEGKWKFFSEITEGYLVSEDEYSGNIRHGTSVKYYTNGTVAEHLTYVNGNKDGEWLQYYENGKIFLKSHYTEGMLNGKFEVWFENGQLQYSGYYKNNLREGKWIIYHGDGSVRYEINYTAGITKDKQMQIEASEFLDMLEKNKGKIADPEKSGEIIR